MRYYIFLQSYHFLILAFLKNHRFLFRVENLILVGALALFEVYLRVFFLFLRLFFPIADFLGNFLQDFWIPRLGLDDLLLLLRFLGVLYLVLFLHFLPWFLFCLLRFSLVLYNFLLFLYLLIFLLSFLPQVFHHYFFLLLYFLH